MVAEKTSTKVTSVSAAPAPSPEKSQEEPKLESIDEIPERPEPFESSPPVAPEAKVPPVKETKKQEEPVPAKTGLNPLRQSMGKPIPKKVTNPMERKFGASYDSATLSSAIGLLDLKSLCRSFSYAILQHIQFARGRQTFSELGKEGEVRFSYKFGKMLKIDLVPPSVQQPLPQIKTAAGKELDIGKSKDIMSDSLAAMTGTRISRDLLSSYLTVEENKNEDDDLDLSFTQSHIGEIFGNSGSMQYM